LRGPRPRPSLKGWHKTLRSLGHRQMMKADAGMAGGAKRLMDCWRGIRPHRTL
jgi:hypothetical protein